MKKLMLCTILLAGCAFAAQATARDVGPPEKESITAAKAFTLETVVAPYVAVIEQHEIAMAPEPAAVEAVMSNAPAADSSPSIVIRSLDERIRYQENSLIKDDPDVPAIRPLYSMAYWRDSN